MVYNFWFVTKLLPWSCPDSHIYLLALERPQIREAQLSPHKPSAFLPTTRRGLNLAYEWWIMNSCSDIELSLFDSRVSFVFMTSQTTHLKVTMVHLTVTILMEMKVFASFVFIPYTSISRSDPGQSWGNPLCSIVEDAQFKNVGDIISTLGDTISTLKVFGTVWGYWVLCWKTISAVFAETCCTCWENIRCWNLWERPYLIWFFCGYWQILIESWHLLVIRITIMIWLFGTFPMYSKNTGDKIKQFKVRQCFHSFQQN